MLQADSPITPQIQAALMGLDAWPVLAFEPCKWGFTNKSWVLTAASQLQLVLQIPQGATPHIVAASRDLPALLEQVGIRSPRLLYCEPDGAPPFLIREFIPGQSSNTTISDVESAVKLASILGTLLPRLARVSTNLDWLPRIWADADSLRAAVDRWCEQANGRLSDGVRVMIAAACEQIGAICADAPVFSHGDFCPVNVLLEGDQIVGLLDLEHAHCASPLFDAAWWGWIVRYHHAQRWVSAWPQLLRTAQIPDDPQTIGTMEAIQVLHCLELCATGCVQQHEQRASMWAERLEATRVMRTVGSRE